MNIFCSEKIIAVYQSFSESFDDDGDLFLDCCYDMALHLLGRDRIVLETENYYISLQADGVFLQNKNGSIESITRDGEWLDESSAHDYESILFPGERLLSVKSVANGYELTFDNFVLQLVSHKDESTFPPSDGAYDRWMRGTERLITRKCKCGGTGKLICDFVDDYRIECDRCYTSTYASQTPHDAIDDWNAGKTPLIMEKESPEKSFYKDGCVPIRYIAPYNIRVLRNDSAGCLVACEWLIAEIRGQKYWISSRYAGYGKRDFLFRLVSDFNADLYPHRIISSKEEPLRLIKKERENDPNPNLLFYRGERPMRITADRRGLLIDLPAEQAVF